MSDFQFMKKAIDEALNNVLTNHGGPFGAIVVKDGDTPFRTGGSSKNKVEY